MVFLFPGALSPFRPIPLGMPYVNAEDKFTPPEFHFVPTSQRRKFESRSLLMQAPWTWTQIHNNNNKKNNNTAGRISHAAAAVPRKTFSLTRRNDVLRKTLLQEAKYKARSNDLVLTSERAEFKAKLSCGL